ncbi:hypothetical protein [Candidatus Palauibacter sp.]|uniref:hypothetical protein n=1 Tax=Candidatus Palauibacter sp. TaxID=3101350 RepID=UPI003B5179CF
MELFAFQLLYDNIHDFKTTAMHVESEIRHHGIRSDSDGTVPTMQGRKHRDMWVSMKTVSHYNLGVALELMLKLILHLTNKPIPRGKQGHCLAKLYGQIPEEYQDRLESTYRSVLPADGLTLIAFACTPTRRTPPQPPVNREISNLQGWFEYLDSDLRWWEKRYSWEALDGGRWCHHLSDISTFVELINRVMLQIERPSVAGVGE